MLSRLLSLLLVFLSLGQATLNAYVDQTGLGGMLFLVNREYLLLEGFVPEDMVKPEVLSANGSILMQREAAQALEKLFEAAKDEAGYQLMAVSGYRSFGQQRSIYSRKVQETGNAKKAQRLVAPPGASEHQLGLAMDVGRKASQNLNQSFGKSPEGQWLDQNAARFGYIIRYRAEWTEITGYAYEPWHIRYVGVEHATRLQALHIPLESYVDQLYQAQQAMIFGEEAS